VARHRTGERAHLIGPLSANPKPTEMEVNDNDNNPSTTSSCCWCSNSNSNTSCCLELPVSRLFDLGDASANWRTGLWEFDLRGVMGARSSEHLEGRQFVLHFKLCGSSARSAFRDAAAPEDSSSRSLFIVRVVEDATSSVIHLMRARQQPPPTSPRVADCNPPCCIERSAATAPLPALSRLDDALAALMMRDELPRGDSGATIVPMDPADRPLIARSTRQLASERLPAVAFWPASGSHVGCACSGRGSCQAASSAKGGSCPIKGLLVGPLQDHGSFGRVHRGVYNGRPVAVKVRPCLLSRVLSQFILVGWVH